MYELVVKCANAVELKELAERLDGYPGHFAPGKKPVKLAPEVAEPKKDTTEPAAELEGDTFAPKPPRKLKDKPEVLAEKAVEKTMKEPAAAKFTYDDVKKVTMDLPRDKAVGLLAKFGCTLGPQLKEAQWPEYIAEGREMLANAELA